MVGNYEPFDSKTHFMTITLKLDIDRPLVQYILQKSARTNNKEK